jgi:Peroxisome biogenesis factor 1, N-terminal
MLRNREVLDWKRSKSTHSTHKVWALCKGMWWVVQGRIPGGSTNHLSGRDRPATRPGHCADGDYRTSDFGRLGDHRTRTSKSVTRVFNPASQEIHASHVESTLLSQVRVAKVGQEIDVWVLGRTRVRLVVSECRPSLLALHALTYL